MKTALWFALLPAVAAVRPLADRIGGWVATRLGPAQIVNDLTDDEGDDA